MKWLVNGVEMDIPESAPEDIRVREIDGRLLVTTDESTKSALVVRKGDTVYISYGGQQFVLEKLTAARRQEATSEGDARAPMPGQVVEVYVAEGDEVEAGQKLLVLEAMKMQHPIAAPYDGIVEKLPFAKGDQVAEGDLLVHVEQGE